MLFGHYYRYQYAEARWWRVICQLRFPTILSHPGSQEPAAFSRWPSGWQAPRYAVRQRTACSPGGGRRQPGPQAGGPNPRQPIYIFVSADGLWKLNLTSRLHRPVHPGLPLRWEEASAQRLDSKPLASFIQLYQPAFLSASVWRYAQRRLPCKGPGLEDVPWVLPAPSSPPSWGSWPSWTWTSRRPAAPRWTPAPGPSRRPAIGSSTPVPRSCRVAAKGPRRLKLSCMGTSSVAGSLSADRVPAVLEGSTDMRYACSGGAVTSDLQHRYGP